MSFFGSLFNGIKKIGKAIGNGIRKVGKVVKPIIRGAKKVHSFASTHLQHIPVVGKYVKKGLDATAAPIDVANDAVDAGERIGLI